MKVLSIGKAMNPRLVCPKEIKSCNEEFPNLIPIAVKYEGDNQRFRLPFKNESLIDLDIDFSFIKLSNDTNEDRVEDYF